LIPQLGFCEPAGTTTSPSTNVVLNSEKGTPSTDGFPIFANPDLSLDPAAQTMPASFVSLHLVVVAPGDPASTTSPGTLVPLSVLTNENPEVSVDEGESVGAGVGSEDGVAVGSAEGWGVGSTVGSEEGVAVGSEVGVPVGSAEGWGVG